MKKRFWIKAGEWVCAAIIIACISVAAIQGRQQLPPREQTTVQDLKDQIADCAISSRNQTQYESKLIARIAELEKQLAELKPKPAEKSK